MSRRYRTPAAVTVSSSASTTSRELERNHNNHLMDVDELERYRTKETDVGRRRPAIAVTFSVVITAPRDF